jgi:hypothetical protein
VLEVGTTVAVELSVEVGEETALEEGVLGEVNAADDPGQDATEPQPYELLRRDRASHGMSRPIITSE